MPSRLERDEEADFKRKVKKELGIESIKMNLQGNRGWPDRLFLLPLRPAFIEFKRGKAKPEPLQDYRIVQMKLLGYDVIWTNDYDTAFNWLKTLHAARVSEKSNQASNRAGVRGPVSGPRFGEDWHKSRRS